MRFLSLSAMILALAVAAGAQNATSTVSQPLTQTPSSRMEDVPARPGQAPEDSVPLSAHDSSSRSLIIDLSPPVGDLQKHPDSEAALEANGVSEMHLWDPHRAAKDDEVGNYYLKQENYRGALWRFEDALKFKPNDAEATFRMAQIYQKTNDPAQAASYYQKYLKVLPYGVYAKEARAQLEKLGVAATK